MIPIGTTVEMKYSIETDADDHSHAMILARKGECGVVVGHNRGIFDHSIKTENQPGPFNCKESELRRRGDE